MNWYGVWFEEHLHGVWDLFMQIKQLQTTVIILLDCLNGTGQSS